VESLEHQSTLHQRTEKEKQQLLVLMEDERALLLQKNEDLSRELESMQGKAPEDSEKLHTRVRDLVEQLNNATEAAEGKEKEYIEKGGSQYLYALLFILVV